MESRNKRTKGAVSLVLGFVLAFQFCPAVNAQVTYNLWAGEVLPSYYEADGTPVYDIAFVDGFVWSLEIDCQPAIVNFDAPFDAGTIYVSAFGCPAVDCPGPTLNFGPNATAGFIWAGACSHINLFGGTVDGLGLLQVDLDAQVTIYGDEFDVDSGGQTTTYGPGTVLYDTGYTLLVSAYDVQYDGDTPVFTPRFSGPVSITPGAFVLLDTIYEEPVNLELDVQIDVKPGSDPTVINMCSNGKVPVAVLSDEVFDATQVLPETVEFAGASVVLCRNDRYAAYAWDINGDGYDDMVFYFRTKDLQVEEGVTQAALALTGQFMSQDYLVTISGTEEVYVLWPKKKWSHAFVNNGFHHGKHRRGADCDRPDKDKKPRGKK